MAFDFPDSPAVNDEYVSGGATYFWTGLVWDLQTAGTIADKVDKAGDTMTGPLEIQSATTNGKMSLLPGDATNNGRIDWHNPDGTRKAYIGYSGATTLQINLDGATRLDIKGGSAFVDAVSNYGYFLGDTWHGTYFNGSNTLIFTEYHDRFEWRRQTTGTQPGGDLRMSLYGGNLSTSGGLHVSNGNVVVTNHRDLTKHIKLWNNVSSPSSGGFGFSISSGTINYCVDTNDNIHKFWGGAEPFASITKSAVTTHMYQATAPDAVKLGVDLGVPCVKTDMGDSVDVVKLLAALLIKVKKLEAEVTTLKARK